MAEHTTKRVADVGGGQRKRFMPILQAAEEEGCDTAGATVRFSGSGHPRITVTAPDGQPISIAAACSPKDLKFEQNNARRRIRKAIRRAEERERADAGG